MKRGMFWGVVLTCSLLLVACAADDPRYSSLPGGGDYCLQPTTAMPAFDVQQKVELGFNGRRETMIVELEVDPEGMRFVGLTPFGQKLIEGGFDNHTVRATQLPDKRLSPALLLALLQICLWPANDVRVGLGDSALVEESAGQRQILVNGKPVLQVSYTGGLSPAADMRIVLPAVQMEFEVTTLASDQPQ